jgi:hypothetical protein
VEEDVARLECRNWNVVALNQEGCRKLLKEAEAHPGLYRRWRERERERKLMMYYSNAPNLTLYVHCLFRCTKITRRKTRNYLHNINLKLF